VYRQDRIINLLQHGYNISGDALLNLHQVATSANRARTLKPVGLRLCGDIW